MSRLRACAGQASVEYVALTGVVALVLALAAVLSPAARRGAAGVARTLGCRIAGVACAPPGPPCALARSREEDRLSATLGPLRVGERDVVEVERRSDGSVAVSLLDGGALGPQASLGAAFQVRWADGREAGVDARRRVAVTTGLTTGRTWTFPDGATADAFLRRHTERRDGLRRALHVVGRHWCLACRLAAAGRRGRMPPPDVEVEELSVDVDGRAEVDLGRLGVEARGAVRGAFGRSRVLRGPRRGEQTLYVRLRGAGRAELSAVLGTASGDGEVEGLVALTLDAHGEPVGLSVRASRAIAGEAALEPSSSSLGALLAQVDAASIATGSPVLAEWTATLDLHAPALRDAAERFLAALDPRRRQPGQVADRARALAEAVDGAGTLELIRRRPSGMEEGVVAEAGAGAGAGVAYDHTRGGSTLIEARTRPPGGNWLERDDCSRAAATA